MPKKTVLIHDDDPRVCLLMKRTLAMQGINSQIMESSNHLLQNVINTASGLVILDLNLPEEDGITIARQIKAICKIPIIMVTGRGQTHDKVKGFESGADDYLPKPFALEELVVRVKKLMDLYGEMHARDNVDTKEVEIIPGVLLGCSENLVSDNEGTNQRLTGMEAKILRALLEHRGEVVSREYLGRLTTGAHWQSTDRGVDVHISRIRRKIAIVSDKDNIIESIRGVGYRMFNSKV